MKNPTEWKLWENKEFTVVTLSNPLIPKEEGVHLIIQPNKIIERGWDDPKLCGRAFSLGAKIAKVIIEKVKFSDWANLQYNGNYGLLSGNKLNFHVHIFGRKKTSPNWGQPVPLPKSPGTFNNEPLSENGRKILIVAFKKYL